MIKKRIKTLFTLITLLVSMPLLAQTSSDSRSLETFNAVKVMNSIEAELVKGDVNEIEITASGIGLDRIETKINNRTLTVQVKGSNIGSSSIKAKITYIDIDELSATTSARIFVKDILNSKQVTLSAATSSYIEAEVNTQKLTLDAATKAKIFVTGTAENLDLNAFTDAEIDGTNLEVEAAQVRANTAARANFTVNKSIEGRAATAAKIYYQGDPSLIDVRTNTGGVIERGK